VLCVAQGGAIRPAQPGVPGRRRGAGEVRGGPRSIPDWLGLVGDTADGFPGLPGWGAKSAAAVLAHYKHLEHIPDAPGKWEISVRSAARLAATLAQQRSDAYLFRTIATLQTDADVGTVDDWRWSGPTPQLGHYAQLLDAPDLLRSAQALTNR
jgi:5'-3' exonuclease